MTPTNSSVRVMIADDHQIFIDGLCALLAEESKIEILGTAKNGKILLDMMAEDTPDVVLLDINMPEMDGIETTSILSKQFKDVKVIILSTYDDVRIVKRIIKAGADGFLVKNTSREDLLAAIEKVQSGKKFYSSHIQEKIISSLTGEKPEKSSQFNYQSSELTERETEIVGLIAKELSGPEIAKSLFLSLNTVNTHRKHILKKLNVKNTAGIVKYALKNGLID